MTKRPLLSLNEYRVLSGEKVHLHAKSSRPPKLLIRLYQSGLIERPRTQKGAWAWEATDAGKRVAEIEREKAEAKDEQEGQWRNQETSH